MTNKTLLSDFISYIKGPKALRSRSSDEVWRCRELHPGPGNFPKEDLQV